MRQDRASKKRRRKSKEACQEARDERTNQEQLNRLDKLGSGALKERTRLHLRISREKK